MNNLFLIIFLLSIVAIAFFGVKAIVQYMRKDNIKGKKQFKFAGIAAAAMVISFIGFGITMDPAETASDEKIEASTSKEEEEEEEEEAKAKEAKETEEKAAREAEEAKAGEEKEAKEKAEREAKEAEEKAVAEAKAAAEQKSKKKTEAQAKAKAAEAAKVSPWLNKVKEVAVSQKSLTEKFDEIDFYALDYKSNKNELAKFEEEILKAYESGKYLSDIKNDEYMLENIFKSAVVYRHYEDVDQTNPMINFAFDFYQNSKYTYRGVDAVDSEAVKSNEEQMNKALKEIK